MSADAQRAMIAMAMSPKPSLLIAITDTPGRGRKTQAQGLGYPSLAENRMGVNHLYHIWRRGQYAQKSSEAQGALMERGNAQDCWQPPPTP